MSPVVNTIEISQRDSCLVVLTSGRVVETIIFSLKFGSLLRRHTTRGSPESRKRTSGATYHVQHDADFARDAQYQVRNQTHKDRPPVNNSRTPNRWLRISENRDECLTGSYEETISTSSSEPSIPCPLPQHSVAFARQAITFTALRDSYDSRSVHRICLRIDKGQIGAERPDSDGKEAQFQQRAIGSPTGELTTQVGWTHRARMSAPQECIGVGEDGGYVDTQEWCLQRNVWLTHTVLLGDEKALVLALPHQLVVWRFETQQMYADRAKKRFKRLALEGLVQIVLIPGYLAAAVGAVPLVLAIVTWNVCSYLKEKAKGTEVMRRRRQQREQQREQQVGLGILGAGM